VIKQVLVPKTKRDAPIDTHPSLGWGWENLWTYQGDATKVVMPAAGNVRDRSRPFWLARPSGMGADEQQRIAAAAHVRVYGPDVWVVDQREKPAPIDAYSMNEREPNPFEWLVFGGTEPVRKAGTEPDPWETWEWRTHFGQPAAAPSGAPATLDQERIAYNVAIAAGDDAGAARIRQHIESQLDRSTAATFTSGVRLIGTRVTGGVRPRVESWFECTEPMGDAAFFVRSHVEARSPLSLIPADATDREMAFPPSLPTKLWKPRFLYMTDAVLNHRIGTETYTGRWQSRDGSGPPRRADNKPDTTIAVVP
jgi:hypothetical protein